MKLSPLSPSVSLSLFLPFIANTQELWGDQVLRGKKKKPHQPQGLLIKSNMFPPSLFFFFWQVDNTKHLLGGHKGKQTETDKKCFVFIQAQLC